MRLILAYPPNFGNPKEVSDDIRGYFPRLVTAQHFMESQSLVGCFRGAEIVRIAESVARPDWKADIVFVALSGPICAYDDLLVEDCAGTLQTFLLGQKRSLPRLPRIGGYYNMSVIRSLGLLEDTKFLSKLAAEEILHIFDVPKNHDPLCFFHSQTRLGKAGCANEYCERCLTLMSNVAEPLDYGEIYRLVDTLYGDRSLP